MTIFAGFCAACIIWFLRHFVEEAFWESNEGWKKSLWQDSTSATHR